MAITNVQVPSLQVGSFSNSFIDGTDIPTFIQSLSSLDINNPQSCQETVERCNDRCNNNTTVVAVAFVGGPVKGAAESFQVQFTIGAPTGK